MNVTSIIVFFQIHIRMARKKINQFIRENEITS